MTSGKHLKIKKNITKEKCYATYFISSEVVPKITIETYLPNIPSNLNLNFRILIQKLTGNMEGSPYLFSQTNIAIQALRTAIL